jgi:DNA-binding protein Fis
LEFIEKEHIKNVLSICKGNLKKAAEAIGYSINTLRSKLKEYEFDPLDFK